MIRIATQNDIQAILPLMRDFADTTPMADLYCPRSFSITATIGIAQGVCWVAVEDEVVVGFCLGCIAPSPWNTRLKGLNEVALWMDADCRNTSGGLQLFSAYVKRARELLDEGTIAGAFFNTLETTCESGEKMVSSVFTPYERGYFLR